LGIEHGDGGSAVAGMELRDPLMRHRSLPSLGTPVRAHHFLGWRDADGIEVVTGNIERRPIANVRRRVVLPAPEAPVSTRMAGMGWSKSKAPDSITVENEKIV